MTEIVYKDENVEIVTEDKLGIGQVHYEYSILIKDRIEVADIKFQNGPIQEFYINGCQQEDLLRIVIHRLQAFQAGPFSCRENALALTKIQEALHWLNHRTQDRINRNVEGKSKL